MSGALGRVSRLWPVGAAAAIVFATVATQPRLVVCPDNGQGFGGVGGQGLCLPTLVPPITGANPIAVVVSWIAVGALIAFVLWMVARFVQRRGDI